MQIIPGKYFTKAGANLYDYGYGNYDRIGEFLEQMRMVKFSSKNYQNKEE